MASIVQRGNSYNVVYLYDAEDGKRKQKWESFKTLADGKRRKSEVEYRQQMGSMVIPNCKTVEDLMREYVAIYGKNTWSLSMYSSTNALMDHYILPLIGSMKLSDITARVLEKAGSHHRQPAKFSFLHGPCPPFQVPPASGHCGPKRQGCF